MSALSRRTLLRQLVACGMAVLAAARSAQARAAALSGAEPELPSPANLPVSRYIPDNAQAHEFRQQFNLSCEVAAFKIVLIHYQLANVGEELLQDLLGANENPNKGFRGDYRALTTDGLRNYGAHAPALAALIARFPAPGMFRPVPLASLDQVRRALTRNWLVMAWIPVALEPSQVQALTLSTGEKVNVVPGEHVIVLHGYDPAGFFTYDPRPAPRVPAHVDSAALARGMGLFDQPALALQPLF